MQNYIFQASAFRKKSEQEFLFYNHILNIKMLKKQMINGNDNCNKKNQKTMNLLNYIIIISRNEEKENQKLIFSDKHNNLFFKKC